MTKAIRTVTTQVRSITPDGDAILIVELADPDDWELPPFVAGNHIDLHLPGGHIRSYSLCGAPKDSRRYRVAIKREDGGRGGSISAHGLQVGNVLPVSLPRGRFLLAANARDHIFIAGGIGVTPFVSMASSLANGPYTLHIAHRGAPPLAAFIATTLPAARVRYHRSDGGRPRAEIGALIGDYHSGRHVYCCGPDSLIDAVANHTCGWPEGHVHIEHFVPPVRSADPDARDYEVILSISNKSFTVEPGASLLEALRQQDVEVDASCEGGICGACRVRWLDGEPVHHDRILTPKEREQELLVCVSGCASSRLVLEL